MRTSTVLYLVCVLACSLFVVHCGSRSDDVRVDVAAIERSMAAALPLQSTPQQALQYLDREKIKHAESVQRTAEGNVIDAIIRRRSQWRLVYTDITIVFKFDAENRLVARDLKPVSTGP